MRRLYPRGRASRGIAVDAEGAMLGPDCVLVRRTPAGFRCIAPSDARLVQLAALGASHDRDWLFQQSRRIADALTAGELALAQIYGLRIPLGDLDEAGLQHLAYIGRLIKANFNPDEPRIPAGEPGAGEWTDGEETEADEPGGPTASTAGDGGSSGDGEPPPEAGGEPGPPAIPAERPDSAKERNGIVRRAAIWLRQAAARSATSVTILLSAIEAAAWVVEYLPEIRSYQDAPKRLDELQNAVDNRQPGYEDHHIVERHYGSIDPSANSQRFGDRLETRENLVRIPYWKHVEISSWYSRNNVDYGGVSPRAYLRGKSWNEQYEVGLRALRDFGVLK